MVHKSQICFNFKLNMRLYMHSVLVSIFIMLPILKLRNYIVPGLSKPETLNYYSFQKMTNILILNNHETFSVYRGHVKQIL